MVAAEEGHSAAKYIAVAEREQQIGAKAGTTSEKLRQRIDATSRALAKARAELAATQKRQALLVKMAEKKETAITTLLKVIKK